MSNKMRQIVELTSLKRLGLGLAPKALLLHLADTVRDDTGLCWRTHENMAKRLGTDDKSIRRNLRKLLDTGLIACVEERTNRNGTTNYVYAVNVPALLSLPSVEPEDTRHDWAEKLAECNRGGEPVVQGLRAGRTGVESRLNHKEPYLSTSAEKKRDHLQVVHSARELPDHLRDDPDFAAFLAEKEAGR